jgi:hypothetical protein
MLFVWEKEFKGYEGTSKKIQELIKELVGKEAYFKIRAK